ncbi:MAG: mechanosensitive ion channel family protein [Bdellovibrionales bacterium]|nr:mechanosensitive ion channel family protein [Bdellovibrionales bacterium]
MKESFLPANKIHELLQPEPALALIGLALSSWILYKFLLREVSSERHKNLGRHFAHLLGQILIFVGFFSAYSALDFLPSTRIIQFIQPYIGLGALILGATIFIKTLRVLILEYLFLGHMKVGVPLLLVNLFTLLASLIVGAWMLTEIFGLKIGPLLATSAIFSVVLGLALQDTLGNLFAGVSLQIDKPYEIGHWIEIQNGNQRWVGQVYEISWRSTVLIGLSDELMTIPNRMMSQAQISNFSIRTEPFARSQVFKVGYGADLNRARDTLLECCRNIPEIQSNPAPVVYITEAQDGGVTLKVAYFLQDYGSQFRLQDRVLSAGLKALEEAGVPASYQRHQVHTVQNSL